jgi:hypothetical protein
MKSSPSFTHLSNQDLLAEVTRLAACERQATAALIACLIEVDTRRLYLGEGCSSLFTSARRSSISPSTPRTAVSRRRERRDGSRAFSSCLRTATSR